MGCRSATVASSSRPGRAERLGREFFDRPTARVARELLGAVLTVRRSGTTRRVRLVETEAYVAHDPANHAARGPTRRNRSMFGPPGTLYVYRIHQVVCANLVTRPAQAVLLRAGDPLGGWQANASGPGRLCRALRLTLDDDGIDTTRDGSLALRPRLGPVGRIVVGPRVGLRQAADRPLRFVLAGEAAVSRPRPATWADPAIAASPRRSRAAGGSRQTRRRRRPPSGGGRNVARSAGR